MSKNVILQMIKNAAPKKQTKQETVFTRFLILYTTLGEQCGW